MYISNLRFFFYSILFLVFGRELSADTVPVSSDGVEDKAYTFDRTKIKRDPFLPPDILFMAKKEDITKFDTLEFRLVAILHGLGAPQAMLVSPTGSTYVVQKGDRVGRRNGRVNKITSTEISIREAFQDNRNQTKSNNVTLVISE